MAWTEKKKAEHSSSRAATHLLGFALCASPVLLGGVPLWAALVSFGLVGLSAALLLGKFHRSKPPLTLVSALGLALSVTMGVRLIPGVAEIIPEISLPPSTLFALLPDLDRRLLHFAPGHAPREILHILTLTLAATSAHLICCRRPEAQGTLMRWILAGGILVVSVGYLDLALNLDSVAGIYKPVHDQGDVPFFSTLINSNHLGGYLVFITGLAVGVAVIPDDEREGSTAFFLAIGAVCGVVLTLSRGSIAAAASLGAFLFLLAIFRRRSRSRGKKWSITEREFGIIGMIGIFFGASALAVGKLLLHEFSSGGQIAFRSLEGKFGIWSGAIWTLRQFPWTGVGPGGFSDAVAPYQAPGPDGTWTHVENLPLQVLTDHGMLIGGIALLMGIYILVTIARNNLSDFRNTIFVGAVGALLIQNLFDFNLYYVGTGLPLAATLGMLSARTPALETRRVKFGIPTLATLVFALALVPSALSSQRAHVAEGMNFASTQAKSIDDSVRADLRLFPYAGNYIALAGKVVERTQGLEAALPWYRAARVQSPVRHFAALLAATAFQRAGYTEEAANDYRDVCLLKPSSKAVQTEWARFLVSLPNGRSVMDYLARIHPGCATVPIVFLRNVGQAGAMYEMSNIAFKHHKRDFRIRFFRGQAALMLGKIEEARLDAAHLMGRNPDRPEGMILEGMIRSKDDPETAMSLFEQALERGGDWRIPVRTYRVDPWEDAVRRWAELAIRTKKRKPFLKAINILRTRYARTNHVHLLRARFALNTGNPELAEREFARVRQTVMARPELKLQYLQALIGVHRESSARSLCIREDRWPDSYLTRVRTLCATMDLQN